MEHHEAVVTLPLLEQAAAPVASTAPSGLPEQSELVLGAHPEEEPPLPHDVHRAEDTEDAVDADHNIAPASR